MIYYIYMKMHRCQGYIFHYRVLYYETEKSIYIYIYIKEVKKKREEKRKKIGRVIRVSEHR